MASKTLTISGYEWRLKVFFKGTYDSDYERGFRISYFKTLWDLDDVAYKRMREAARRLCKREIIFKRIIDGKVVRGSFIYNPNYKKKSQK